MVDGGKCKGSMRTVLVFPPHASPTYVPLGIASLAAYLHREIPSCQAALLDVNLTAWEYAAAMTPGGIDCMDFFRGKRGNFLDQEEYSAEQRTWRSIEAALTRLGARAKRYLDVGEENAELMALLDLMTVEILSTDPELVGFSLFSLGQIPWTIAMAKRLRSIPSPSLKIILGGAACSAFRADELLRACPAVDGVVVGEGEAGLAALCRGALGKDVPGFIGRGQVGLTRTLKPQTSSLRDVPVPGFQDLPLHRYLNPAPVLPMLFSRGCKWRRCRFCAHTSSFSSYRSMKISKCVDHMEELSRRHGARHFYFADLYVDALDLEVLANNILARGLDVSFHVLGRPTSDFTPERLKKLAMAGCRWISWGVESGSQRLLDIAAKGTSTTVVERVLLDAHAVGISNLMLMIFGLPTSTSADFEATFSFIERMYPYVDAMTASSFALFEGTSFARNAARFGLVPTASQEEVRVDGVSIHSRRLNFLEVAEDGAQRSPRGPVEVEQWRRRRQWLGAVSFLEGVGCEHYLLHVSGLPFGSQSPLKPRRRAA